jgi:hypothetical protein
MVCGMDIGFHYSLSLQKNMFAAWRLSISQKT